jgi:hypothetical protein
LGNILLWIVFLFFTGCNDKEGFSVDYSAAFHKAVIVYFEDPTQFHDPMV